MGGGRVLQGLSLLFKDCSRAVVRTGSGCIAMCMACLCYSKTCLMLSLVVDGLPLLSKDLFKGHR